jgi:hypothetical protein
VTAVSLPISGLQLRLRTPTGAEDLLLLESPGADLGLAVALLDQVVEPVGGGCVDWSELPLMDVDVLLIRLRGLVFGDDVRAGCNCPMPNCGTAVEANFRITDYLAFHQPRAARGVEPSGEPGWFHLRETPVTFRLPVVGDLLAIADAAEPGKALIRRCLRPADVAARLRHRVERAMEALAPGLHGEIAGSCPGCGIALSLTFDPIGFCLRELVGQARFVYDDVHILAGTYHWMEETILAMPTRRRAEYATRARAAWIGG